MRAMSCPRRALFLLLALGAVSVLAAPPRKPARKPVPKAAPKKAPKAAAKAAKPAPGKAPGRPPPTAGRLQPKPLGARGVPASVRPKPGTDRIGEPAPGSKLPTAPPVVRTPAALWLTTGAGFEARLDWKPDALGVAGPALPAEDLARLVQGWKATGAAVHRRLPGVVDAGGAFSRGRDPDVQERDAAGMVLQGPAGVEVTPTGPWVGHLKDQARLALEAGADGVWLDEPAPSAAAGRSPAFQAAWKAAYGTDWTDPLSGPAAFFKGARLRSDLGLYALNDLLGFSREFSRDRPARPMLMLSSRAPTALAAEGRVFPLAAASRLPVDGVVGRIPAADALRPVLLEGRRVSLPFESAWLMASYFSSLVEGLPQKSLVLAPEAAQDPRVYPQLLAASLLAGQAKAYGLPDPAALAGTGGTGSPGDADALAVLAHLATALKEVPAGEPAEGVAGGSRGIGVLALDSLGYQQGGPGGGSLAAVWGQTLPLLSRGVPVHLVPAERLADPGYLARYRVLLLSFELQKPLGPELAAGLADWIKGGGVLILFGSEDAYNGIGEWWNRNGLASPADHLIRQCTQGVDASQRLVLPASDRFREILKAAASAPALEGAPRVVVPLGPHLRDGQPLFVRFSDATPGDGGGARLGRARVVEGDRVRADFVAGGPGERAFLVEEAGTAATAGSRMADGEAGFVYRFARLGRDARLELELSGGYRLSLAAGEDPAAQLRPGVSALPPVRVPSTYTLSTYALAGAEPLYTLRRAGLPDITPVWQAQHGQGTLIYSGVPAAFGAESAAGGDYLRALVRFACSRAGVEYGEGPLIARRGPLVVAHAMGRTASLSGQYLDLLQPDAPVVENPALPYREAALFRQVKLAGKVPTLVHASHRARVLEATAARTRVLLEGPTGARGVLRLFPAGMSLTGALAVDAGGLSVPVEVDPEGRTLRFRYAQQAGGITLTLSWIRPEARLTK